MINDYLSLRSQAVKLESSSKVVIIIDYSK